MKSEWSTEVQAWERIYELVQNFGGGGRYTALKKSVEQKLVFVYAHVYYRMAHSPYANDAKLN